MKQTKQCFWPWNHKWTKWKTINSGTANYIFGGECVIYLQERVCTKCNKIEHNLEKVS